MPSGSACDGVKRAPFSIAGLDHIVLRVPNMIEALVFYCDVLGAREERRIERANMVQLRFGHSLIDLIDDANANVDAGQGLDHICLRLESWDEASITQHLASFGVDVIERGSRFGAQGAGPSVYVRDPFGTVIELKGPATPVEADAPVLRTAQLILRPTRISDAEALLPLFADEESMRYWSHIPVKSVEEVRQIIARNLPPQNDPDCSFVVTFDGQAAIGCINIYDESDAMAGLGYILGRAHWGQGLISEALGAMIEHGFQTLNLHRIRLEIDPRNSASIRVAEKNGFSAEGVQRQSYLLDGAYLDSAYFGLLREDWLRLRGAGAPSAK